MGLLRGLLGGGSGKKEAKSAWEALPSAQEALEARAGARASSAQLCCVYSSSEDSGRELQRDGRCRAWHFDFHLPASKTFYLVRVVDGRAKGRERKEGKAPVEYIFAMYGSGGAERGFAAPVAVSGDWVDSTSVAEAAFAALKREMADLAPEELDDFILLSMFCPALYLRYLHPEWKPKFLHEGAPAQPCYAALLGHIDADAHDSLVVYVDAVTGTEVASERFRFPAYASIGYSGDW